jgi:Protein of unknown function with HXXEE motif
MRNLLNYSSDTCLLFWLSMFPMTYLAHIAEEYWGGGGYSAYLLRTYFVELSPTRFLALQSLGVLLMLIGVFASFLLRFPYTMLAILAAVILVNGVIHSVRSLFEWNYTPGLITAALFWAPLGAASIALTWTNMNTRRFLFSVIVGSVISFVVEVIAMRGGKLVIRT